MENQPEIEKKKAEKESKKPELTPEQQEIQSLVAELSRLRAELESNTPGEARGIVWADFFGVSKDENDEPHMFKVSITQRSYVSSGHAFKQFLESVKLAKAFGLQMYPPTEIPGAFNRKAPAPTDKETRVPVDQAESPTIPASKLPGKAQPSKAPVPAAKQPTPASQGDGEYDENEHTMKISKVKITPEPEGRVTVEFFAPNHKFADLKITRHTVESVAENMPTGWGDYLVVAGQYDGLDLIATWKYSQNKSSTGKHYKDVVRVD